MEEDCLGEPPDWQGIFFISDLLFKPQSFVGWLLQHHDIDDPDYKHSKESRNGC